jgi:MFS family permease
MATARLTSQIGSAVSGVVFPIVILADTRSPAMSGYVGVLQAAPYLLFGLLAGVLADRGRRRVQIVATDTMSAVALTAVGFAVWTGHATVVLVYAAVAFTASLFVLNDASFSAMLTEVVKQDRLANVNGLLQAGSAVTSIAGPVIGSTVLAQAGAGPAILVDALSYLLSAVLVGIWGRSHAGDRKPYRLGWRTVGSDIRSGMSYLLGHRILRSLTLTSLGLTASGGALLALVPALVIVTLHASVGAVGLILAVGAAGSLVGIVCWTRLYHRWGPGRVAAVLVHGHAVALIALAWAPDLPAALALMFVWQGLYSMLVVNTINARMTMTPPDLVGRVNATGRMLAWGGQPLGALAGSALTQVAGIRQTLLLMAVPALSCVVIAYTTRLWTGGERDPAVGHGSVELPEVGS